MSAFDDVAEFVAIPRVTELRLSPDGRRLVASVAGLSRNGKKYVSALWQIDPTGDAPARRLTFSSAGESSPRFLPDGSLVFLSKRREQEDGEEPSDKDRAGLWTLPAVGGEARRLAARAGGFARVDVAAEVATVVLTTPTLPGTSSAEEDETLRKEREERDVHAILHDSSPVRYWDADLGPAQLRLVAADASGATSGNDVPLELRDLTPHPGRALDEQHFAVAADGSFVVTGWAEVEEPGLPRAHLLLVDLGSGEQRTLARETGVGFSEPSISPDGRTVVCIRAVDGDYDNPPQHGVWLVDVATGAGRALAADADLWPTRPLFSADGRAVFFTSDQHGRHPIFRVDLETNALSRVASDGHFSELCVARDGSALFALYDRVDRPPVPVRLDPDAVDQKPRLLHAPGHVEVPGRLEEVSAPAADGTTIRAWLALPDTAAPDAPAPLLLWIHGGPLSSFNGWSWRWNPWLMTAKGYAVLLPDPALSTGYGRHMLQRGWGQWGGAPYDDLMTVTDAVVARPDIDPARTAAMGGSYGGYMANWVAGHTDRFRCIVTHASLWSLESFVGATDLPAYWVREWGTPDRDPSRYEKWSPDRFADAIVTPMLVIHGDKDYRVPIGEGLSLWWALQRRGVESKFLYFPDENHWILKPGSAKVWYDTVHAWLATHVLGRDWERPPLV
ncbi:MAG TPA: S9 family peptidase [Mycobacteriales bacterium]|jgi:dipeptidyl aminopeptidase/acylaminoacyl peptidase|nr:S9 family peptidase [Mycobacteriales bacterium]